MGDTFATGFLTSDAAKALNPQELNTPAEQQRAQAMALVMNGWNNPAYRDMFTDLLMPNASDVQKRFMTEMMAVTETPEDVGAFMLAGSKIDVSALAPQIKAPTLVIHVRGDQVVPFYAGAYLASLIPGARLVPIEGSDHIAVPGDGEGEQIGRAVQPFLDQDLEPTTASADR